MNRNEVIAALTNVEQVPQHGKLPRHRTIYETQSGSFSIDYASFPGGTSEDVPESVIRELVHEGVIVPKCPDNPRVKMWILKSVTKSTPDGR